MYPSAARITPHRFDEPFVRRHVIKGRRDTISKIEASEPLDQDDRARLLQLKFWIKNVAEHVAHLEDQSPADLEVQALVNRRTKGYHYFVEARVFDSCASEADMLALLHELEKTVSRILEGRAYNAAHFEAVKGLVNYMDTLPQRTPY